MSPIYKTPLDQPEGGSAPGRCGIWIRAIALIMK